MSVGHAFEAEEHTVRGFDKDLKAIIDSLKEMSNLALISLEMMTTVLEKNDSTIIDAVKEQDKEINEYLNKIDTQVLAIIALRKPLAIDLRFVMSAWRIAIILERVGDVAKTNIKKLTIMDENISASVKKDLQKMISLVSKMIRGSIKAFNKADMGRVDKVWSREEKVDELFTRIYANLKTKMVENTKEIPTYTETLLVIKNLERVGDSATTIVKILEYVETGEWGASRS